MTKVSFEHRLDLVLVHAGLHGFHRFDVCFRGDVRSALHKFDLFGRFQHAHFMQDRAGIDDRLRGFEGFAITLAHHRELLNYLLIDA